MNRWSEIKKNIKDDEIVRDEDNRIIINMNVNDDSYFLSEFSHASTPVISEDVANFLENETSSLPIKEPLRLVVTSDCIDENEKVLYNKAIKQYYTDKYVANEKGLKRNILLSITLACLGIIALALALIVGNHHDTPIWTEVIDIVAWVFLWEAVDVAFFKTHEMRIEKYRYLAFIDMDVKYQHKR